VSIGQEAVKCVVSMFGGGVYKGQHPRHRSPDGTENPSNAQLHKYGFGGSVEKRKELLDKRRPCRYSGSHTNLLVVYGLVSPLQSSGGWYFFGHKSFKLAA
jgi:hypothetical protein